ncbi:transposase [Candidatus Parcubacteria bacterium]|nr:transposase [Candidatus Parcubacteria bacterium]
MPTRKHKLANNEIYHIIIRGVNDSEIFKDINDYYRAIFSIYEFNTINSVDIRQKREQRALTKKNINQGRAFVDNRDLLVEILCFCFMPNHVHLLLKQIKDDGITKFMRKLGSGYASYFNKKYSRKGYLFQGRFFPVHIKTDEQLQVIFAYIHVNSISLIEPKWKEIGIQDIEKVISFLEDYKWSSYPDYIGKKNFPSVTHRNFMLEMMNKEKGCKDFIENWIRYKSKIKKLPDIVLKS